MRRLMMLAALAFPHAVAAQEQQANAAANPAAAQAAGGAAIYDMVAGDRETAWRINRVTGEVVICRVDTTGSLDAARARCAPAVHETPPQQSRVPGSSPGGRP